MGVFYLFPANVSGYLCRCDLHIHPFGGRVKGEGKGGAGRRRDPAAVISIVPHALQEPLEPVVISIVPPALPEPAKPTFRPFWCNGGSDSDLATSCW